MNIVASNICALAVLGIFSSSLPASASAPVDSAMMLPEVEVRQKALPLGAAIDSLGRLTLSAYSLRRGARTLGEADAVRSLTSLPGYESSSDYGSGIVVGGADFTTTPYSIDGAQIFYPFHFAGIFSTFNPNYIAYVRVNPAASFVASPFMLGANIDARSSQFVPSRLSGSASIGMLASGASLALPLAHHKLALRGAVRAAYLPSASFDDTSLNYDFIDANFSAQYDFSDNQSLSFSSFVNSDKLTFSTAENTVDSRLRWKNFVNSLAFTSSGTLVDYSINAAFSHYESSLCTVLSPVSLILDSDIDKMALSAEARYIPCDLELGLRIEHSSIQPMHPQLKGSWGSGAAVDGLWDGLCSIGAAKSWRAGAFTLRAGARAALYETGDYHYAAFDPQLSVAFPWHGRWRVSMGHYSQFQHLVGLSDFGFASNFWLVSSADLKPERQWGIDISYDIPIADALNISVKGFAKRVVNSAQYMATVLDVIDPNYDPYLSTVATDGFNLGGDVLLAFDYGVFSGFGGYSLALCRRRDPYFSSWTSSATEPLHSAKASLTYRSSPRLNLSAFFTLSSGRPYTPINAVYIIAGNIITDYGILNSARLPLYHRLDISATYTFPDIRLGKERIRNFANFSLINALGHRNVEMQYFRYREAQQSVALAQVASLYRFLPSVSYTIEF